MVTIKIPSSVKFIGYSAFSGWTALRSIDLLTKIALIGFCAFFLMFIISPESATLIENVTFYRCWSLESIKIPSSTYNRYNISL